MSRITTVVIFYFLFQTGVSYSQDKKSTPIRRTKSSAIINGSKYLLHTVEKGQTLFAIAKFYKMDVNDIVLENPDAINGIKQGQVLRIPVDKKEMTSNDTSSYVIHTVEKGETIYFITKKYNITTEGLKSLNPELKDGLKAGQQLKVPSPYLRISKIPASDKIVIDTPATYLGEFKSVYNIALFLPFNISDEPSSEEERMVNLNEELKGKTSIALQFYEGALIAIDSLKKLKFNAKVFVYDVDDKDSNNLRSILKKTELTKMDLIIGPLYGSSFMPVAKFAKEHGIAIVSPLTKSNRILFNNPFVCKVSPSDILQVEQMACFVTDTFKSQNIILINSQNMNEFPFFNAFKKTANQNLLKAGKPVSDSVKLIFNLNALQSMLSTEKKNVIVLPSDNKAFVSDVLNKLNVLNNKYKIVLFGMQNWINYDNVDYEYFNELSIHVPSNGFVDYEKEATKNFIRKYRERFKAEPDVYTFQGYDVMYYFLITLQKYGSGFLNQLPASVYSGIETGFLFSQFPSDSGFENRSVSILKYENYQLKKAN
ncbi:MAG TPA: LysM peptidoglycan-binding domain-containing protein [Bacteroidia bacterium]|nr:LysM peptidoglycan-binding domain-containing protein [Bacteroidia bacterium]